MAPLAARALLLDLSIFFHPSGLLYACILCQGFSEERNSSKGHVLCVWGEPFEVLPCPDTLLYAARELQSNDEQEAAPLAEEE